MKQEEVAKRREEYYKPQNAIKRKINRYYEWAWIAVLIQILVAQGLSTVLMVVSAFVSADLSNAMETAVKYAIPISAVACTIADFVAAYIGIKINKAKIKDYIHKPQISAGLIVAASFAILAVANIDGLIMTLFSSVFSASSSEVTSNITNGIMNDNIFLSVVSILYVAVVGPILEELLCRGAVLSLTSHISPKFGIFASAFIFGLMHLNVTQFFNAFIMGLLLAYITEKSKSIIPAAIMHIVNNSNSVLMVIASQKLSEDALNTLNVVVTIAEIVLGVIGLIILFTHFKKNPVENQVICNKPATDEEVSSLQLSTSSLTTKVFFTRWSFFVSFSIFLVMVVTSYMMAG